MRIATLRGNALRPTSDQLRETLFNVLGPSVEGARFLDIYAGSGAVGLEALSRGAREVVFIERHRAAAELIHRNFSALAVRAESLVMACAALNGVERLAAQNQCFDFVFLDPPYDEIGEYHRVLRQLGRSRLVRAESLLIAEHSRRVLLEEGYGSLARVRAIRRGDSQLSFYRLAPHAA